MKVRRTLQNSKMLSSDVSAAFDPMYAEVFEKRSAAFFGNGLVFNKFTGSRGKSGSNDANAEYLAEIRYSFGQTLEHTVIQYPDGTRKKVTKRNKKVVFSIFFFKAG